MFRKFAIRSPKFEIGNRSSGQEDVLTHDKVLNRAEVRREVLRLALPVSVSNLLHRMVTAVDIFLVGGLGASAVAAVGLGQLLVFISMTLVWGINVGTMVSVAQRWGGGRRAEAGRIALHGLLATLVVTVPLAVAGMMFAADAASFCIFCYS